MADPHELLSFPDDCEAVAVITEGDAAIEAADVCKVIAEFKLTSASDNEDFTDIIGSGDLGGDSLVFIEAADAGENDCTACGGTNNPERAKICSFGAFLTKAVG